MRFSKPILAAALASALSSAAFAQGVLVKVDGSSTVYPVTEAVAEEFQKAEKNAIKVTVGISGTGGGFKKFCRGETDISGASRPILKSEMDECAKLGITYYELPVAFDALTVVVNPKNTFLDKGVTVEQLKKMWEPGAQGKITRWNQVDPSWPDAPIKLFGAGADSGTFDYFTEAIVGKAKSSARRLHGVGRRQRAGAGRAARRQCDRLLRLRVLRGEPGQAEERADHREGRQAAGQAVDGHGAERQLPAAVPSDLHLRQRQVARASRGEEVRRVLHDQRLEARSRK